MTTEQAFQTQAKSDLAAYNVLNKTPGIAACSWLHCLQMATEKLAKAYHAHTGASFQTVSESHLSFSKYARPLYRDYARRYLQVRLSDRAPQLRAIVSFAREVEQLHPAIDREARPDNCEYPWEDASGQIIAPANFHFDIARRLGEPAGKAFLKFVETLVMDSPGSQHTIGSPYEMPEQPVRP